MSHSSTRLSDAVRSLLSSTTASCILVTNRTNIRYLTGLNVSSGYLLCYSNSAELFVDRRYEENARSVQDAKLTVSPVRQLSARMRKFRTIAYEFDTLTASALIKLQKKYKNTKFVQLPDALREMRRQKSPEELRSMHRACVITKRVLRKVPSLLKKGISELELTGRIETMARILGAEGMAFDTIVGFGEHTSRPHHHPTDRCLRAGDLVQVDMGVRVNGYCSDYSRVFFTGRKTRQQSTAYRALIEAKRSAEALVHAGVDVRALDRTARRVLRSHGYDKEFCHALGHGVGLDIHEFPSIASTSRRVTLKENEVITIEPGLYFEGEWGMRIEDTIVVEK